MAMAIPLISTVAKFIPIISSVGGQIFGGMSGRSAGESEASDIEGQAALERSENLEEARRLREKDRKFLARQSVMFVKGGVSLEGSPMLVLEETEYEKERQFAHGKHAANAKFQFGMNKAERVREQGRAKMTGGLFGGVGSGVSMLMQGQSSGLFDLSKIFSIFKP